MSFLGPYFVGQVPLLALNITVVDETGTAVDITPYSGYQLLVFDPENEPVDTSGGSLSATGTRGVVSYEWPTTSLFTAVGTYSYQLSLTAAGALDYTRTGEFKVLPLGGN